MSPLHAKRTFWWELVFISVLLFLLAGAWSQRKDEIVTAQTALVPAIVPGLVVATPISALK
jgi:hypothetical protein